MALVADYTIIRDGVVTLSTSGGNNSQVFNFSLQDVAAIERRCILTYLLVIRDSNTQLEFSVRLNGNPQGNFNVGNGPSFQTLHEIVGRNVLAHGPDANQLEFSIVNGSGSIQLTDIYLLWKENV